MRGDLEVEAVEGPQRAVGVPDARTDIPLSVPRILVSCRTPRS